MAAAGGSSTVALRGSEHELGAPPPGGSAQDLLAARPSRAPPGSVCALAPGGGGQRAGHHHPGGPALLIRQMCTPALWLLRVVPVARQVPKPPCASVSSSAPKERQKQCGATTPPSVPGPGPPRAGAAARTARVLAPWVPGRPVGADRCGIPYLTLSSRCGSDRRQGNSASMAAAHSPPSHRTACCCRVPRPRPRPPGTDMPHGRTVPVTRGASSLEPLTWAGRASGLSPEHVTFGRGRAQGAQDVGLAPKPKSLRRVGGTGAQAGSAGRT